MPKQILEQTQTQRLSPIQIQTIKLITMPVQELEQEVRARMEENPVLDDTPDPNRPEEEKDISLDEYKQEDSIPAYKLRINNYGKDPLPEYNSFSVKESFSQSLQDQLDYRNLNEKEAQIASFIVGSLDDDGYLRRDIDSLVDDLAFRSGVYAEAQEVEDMLKVVQECDPPGVGARDLRECLLLQLKVRKQTPSVVNASRILSDCFPDFSARHFSKIMSKLDISEEELKDAIDRIKKLNPSPGGGSSNSYEDSTRQIIPDFILEENDGHLSFSMPRSSIPELRINRKYAEMIEDARLSSDKSQMEAAAFVRQKIESAKWLIEAIKQRHNTLNKTMQAILDYQHQYFLTGEESDLRPMVLKDIAAITGFDISTISRVVNSKYIETSFGIIPLKYFFSEGLENSEGEEVSTRELKKALKECVDAEDKTKPLTDEQLVVEMASKGYKVARRTIAKYRDQLGIPLARWRKEL